MARKCELCGTRNVGIGPGWDPIQARVMGYCNPCLTEAEWENTHSDDNHDGGMEGHLSMADCWICHPELNEAAKEYTPRVGHTNTATRSHRSHAKCDHVRTPQARAACRKAGGPKE